MRTRLRATGTRIAQATAAVVLIGVVFLAIGPAWPGALAQVRPTLPLQPAYGLSWYAIGGGGGIGESAPNPAEPEPNRPVAQPKFLHDRQEFHWLGPYALGGIAGQPAAGWVQLPPYVLCAGFWCGVEQARYGVYLPLVWR